MIREGTSIANTQKVSIFVILIILVSMVFIGCQRPVTRLARDLNQLESPPSYAREKNSEDRIRELEGIIQGFMGILEERIQAAGGLATAYKLLGMEYQRLGMHKLALENLEKAIEVESANEILLYMAGTNAAAWADSAPSPEQAQPYYVKSDRYFTRAIEINPYYGEALFSAAVLKHFQLEEHEEALGLINRTIEIQPGNHRAFFVKARILASLGRLEEAADLYGEIAAMDIPNPQKDEARKNQRAILDGIYE